MKTVAVFKYSPAFDPDFGLVFEPIIPITLVNSTGGELRLYPYLDSGADITVLPYGFGTRLGLTPQRGERFEFSGEGGGTVPLVACKVNLRIGASATIPVRVG